MINEFMGFHNIPRYVMGLFDFMGLSFRIHGIIRFYSGIFMGLLDFMGLSIINLTMDKLS